MKRSVCICMAGGALLLVLALAGCSEGKGPLFFQRYDYEHQRKAYLGVKGISADVRVDEEGLRVGRNFKRKVKKAAGKKEEREADSLRESNDKVCP